MYSFCMYIYNLSKNLSLDLNSAIASFHVCKNGSEMIMILQAYIELKVFYSWM